MGVLELLRRYRWLILLAFAGTLFPRNWDARQGDWHYFVTGSKLLFGGGEGGGLHLFAAHPEMHMGPLSFAVTWVLRTGGGSGLAPAEVLMWALGPVSILLLERAALAVRRGDDLAVWTGLTTVLGGAAFMKAWMSAAGIMAHLDDVLAVLFTALAAWAVATRKPWLLGLAIGLATSAKLWGILLLPLCLAAERGGRWRAFAGAAGLTLVSWLPFYLADHATFTADSYAQAIDPGSALRALGVADATMPHWVRPTQVVLSLALATLAVSRGRWPAALAAALGARIALDPSVYGYYTPTILVGALAWDFLGSKRPFPVWTGVTYVGLVIVPWFAHDPSTIGMARLVTSLALVAGAFALPERARRRPVTPARAADAARAGA